MSTAGVCILVLGYTVLYRELGRACCTGDLGAGYGLTERENWNVHTHMIFCYLVTWSMPVLVPACTCIQAFLEAPHVSHFSINEHMPIINSEYRRAGRSVTIRYWDGGLGVPAGIGSSEL